LREKFDDPEFRDYFYKVVTQDIEKIDSVLNGLTNYIKIVTPIEKTNTVHLVLEDILRKNEAPLKDKAIKLFKKYEKDLPETVVHEEQLKYIFNSLLEFLILTIPPNGTIGFLTKSPNTYEHTDPKAKQKDDKGFIYIMIVFTGYKKSAEQFKSVLGIPAPEQEEPIDLELRLIKELIQQNRGGMKVEFNEKKSRTLISLKFPIERRKTVYYPSVNNQ
jgi:nitrogen-specific signal transduction histidine kinase